MIVLLLKSFRHHWSAQTANRVNLIAALSTMILNNIFFIYGMWLMLFDGKPQNASLFPFYLTLTSLAYVGWGALNFFTGGLRTLGELIDSGRLEPMMGTPRSPLLLVAISDSNASALGDLLQGVLTLIVLFIFFGMGWGARAAFSSIVVIFAFAAVFIAAGTVAFFMTRGSTLSAFLMESTLSFTLYPMPKILEGSSRWILYVIPATLTATLPMQWIEYAGWGAFITMVVSTCLAFYLSILFFNRGLKKYQAASYIGSR